MWNCTYGVPEGGARQAQLERDWHLSVGCVQPKKGQEDKEAGQWGALVLTWKTGGFRAHTTPVSVVQCLNECGQGLLRECLALAS